MIFLGLASRFSRAQIWHHLTATGKREDKDKLRQLLSSYYSDGLIERARLFANGRTAIAGVLSSLKYRLPAGSAVVVNGFTCQAVVQGVREAGMVPVFADIDPDSLHFGASQLQACLERHPETKAVIIQNSLGYPADIASILPVARAANLVIIEDLAHCLGLKYANGQEAGMVGDAVVLSFGKGKALDVVGGGAMVMRDKESSILKEPTEQPSWLISFQQRTYPLWGGIARWLFRHEQPKIAKAFLALLFKIHFMARSADGEVNLECGISAWQARLIHQQWQTFSHGFAPMPLRQFFFVINRPGLLKKLEASGFYLQDFWYETPVAPARYYASVDFPENDCPIAVNVASKIINVPTWGDPAELERIITIIQDWQKHPEITREDLKPKDGSGTELNTTTQPPVPSNSLASGTQQGSTLNSQTAPVPPTSVLNSTAVSVAAVSPIAAVSPDPSMNPTLPQSNTNQEI